MFVFALILLVVGVAALVFAAFKKFAATDAYGHATSDINKTPTRIIQLTAVIFIVLGIVILLFASFFKLEPGQAAVLKDKFGNIVGSEQVNGTHFKAPWVDVVTFDVRNQRVVYSGKGGDDNTGGTSDGAQITVQDGDGVTANIDIAIRYSLKPDAVVDIYTQYLNEDNLRTRLIFNDIRSVVRSVPGKYDTIDLLTQRDEVQQSILDALEDRWADDGIIVDDVALQEIRYGKAVTGAFAAAQEAQIAVSKEQANLEATQVSAQQKVVQAQAEADANALLNASLTPAILQQRYLDTLGKLAAEGNLVITDGTNSQILVQR